MAIDGQKYAEFIGKHILLKTEDIIEAAKAVDIHPATIMACMDVESAGDGFNNDGSCKILFERHLFHRYTDQKWSADYPDISNSQPGGYGAGGIHQYERLLLAITLDRNAALRAASWGRFQCLGANYKMIGYDSVETMVTAFKNFETAHLDGFIAYCRATPCLKALQKNPPDFDTFKNSYNGTGANGYAEKMRGAYNKYINSPDLAKVGNNPAPRVDPPKFESTLQFGSSGAAVIELQRGLGASGYMVTGLFNVETREAVKALQRAAGLASVDGVVGPRTREALNHYNQTGTPQSAG